MSNKKSKFVPEHLTKLISEPQFLKQSNKTASQKRRQATKIQKENNAQKLGINNENDDETFIQKLADITKNQLGERKLLNEQLLKSLTEIIEQLEADYSSMKENEQMFEHLNNSLMKCIQQATMASKQKLKTLKDIQASFRKECEELDNENRAENGKLAEELENDIKNLRQKLISESRRSGWEKLRRTIFEAVQNDF